MPEFMVRYETHRNSREGCHIAFLLSRRGFIVDAIDRDDYRFMPKCRYDILIYIGYNLSRLGKTTLTKAIGILHYITSGLLSRNEAELRRTNYPSNWMDALYNTELQIVNPVRL